MIKYPLCTFLYTMNVGKNNNVNFKNKNVKLVICIKFILFYIIPIIFTCIFACVQSFVIDSNIYSTNSLQFMFVKLLKCSIAIPIEFCGLFIWGMDWFAIGGIKLLEFGGDIYTIFGFWLNWFTKILKKYGCNY